MIEKISKDVPPHRVVVAPEPKAVVKAATVAAPAAAGSFGLTVQALDQGTNAPIPGATASGQLVPAVTDAGGNAVVTDVLVTLTAPGYAPYVAQDYKTPSLDAPIKVHLIPLPPAPPVPPMPPVPSRTQVCSVQLHYQGLTVNTGQFGVLPWWPPAMTSLNPADRQGVYAQTKAAQDTHCILPLTWNYDEPGQPYGNMNRVPGRDLSNDLGTYRDLVEEAVRAGFFPILPLGGDGQGNGPGYNTAVGWTYGCDWVMTKLPEVVGALGDLNQYCLYVPGFDAVFYGWTVAQIIAFGKLFRMVLATGHLGLWHGTGHIPCGNGPADYQPGGAMADFDAVLSEYDPNLSQDSCWQVNARLEPNYRRPADQPTGDDPTPPYYMGAGTPRGPYYHCAIEWATYPGVRGQVSNTTVQGGRNYHKSMGVRWTG